MSVPDNTDWVAYSLSTLANPEGREEVTMATTIMEQTARRISEAYGQSHKQLVGLDPQERQRTWEDSVGALSNFDLSEPGDQIQAKAYLDTLEQVLFAATTRTSKEGNGSF